MSNTCTNVYCFILQLKSASLKQKNPFDNVNVEWNLIHDEWSTDADMSEDETVIEDRVRIFIKVIFDMVY